MANYQYVTSDVLIRSSNFNYSFCKLFVVLNFFIYLIIS